MSKGKDLAKNTAIVSIGKICTQLITFFLLPVYTAVLSNEEYGVVDLLNTLTSLLLPIATLQIEQGIFRYLLDCRENKEKQTTLITTVSKFILVQSAICILIFLCASPFIHNEYKYFLMANLLMGILSSISLQICRGLGDNKTYAVGSFITGALTVILNVIFIVAFKWGAYGMLIATAISNLLCAIYVFVKKKIYKYIDIKQNDKKLLKDIVKYSVPLIPNMISWWIVSASDRTIISAVIGVAQNGIYSAANKFSGIFSTLYSVFNLTWTESASININSEDRDEFFSKIFDFIVRFFGSLCLGTIAVMPFVFGILVNEKFAESYYQIPILILGSVFNILVSFLGSVYVAKKLTKEIAKTSIIAAIAYFAMFIYRWIDVKKYVSIKTNKALIAVLSVSFLVAIITYYLKMKIISIVVLLAVIIIAIYINKDSAKYLTEIVKKRFKK